MSGGCETTTGGERPVQTALANGASTITGTTVTEKPDHAVAGAEEPSLACGMSNDARMLGILVQHS